MSQMLTFFTQFDFVIHYMKGRSNVVVDALSCPAVSGYHFNEPSVPINHDFDMSNVDHE